MLINTIDALHTTILAVPQPDAVVPPGGDRIWRMVGVVLWILTGGAVLGVIVGGGVMWFDHAAGNGAMAGKGIKIVIGALIGALIMSLSASWVTWVMT